MTEQDALAAVCDEHGIDLRRLTASHMERPPIGSLPQVIRDRVAAKLAAANAAEEIAAADEHPVLARYRKTLAEAQAKVAAAQAAAPTALPVTGEHPQLAAFRQALRAAGHPTA